MTKKAIRVPKYNLKEELINSISHGVGGGLAIAGLVLMMIKANTPLEYVTCSIFVTTMIILYMMSFIYNALSPKIKGKAVLRVLDHCNVYLLVFGTYIPIVLLGIGGLLGWIMFAIVGIITILGIVFTSINIDKYSFLSVIFHLLNGWSIFLALPILINTMSMMGVFYIILGGLFYSIGAILYWKGAHKKYMHSIFHFFCLAGTLMHFLAIYLFLI